jgi:hypothetical protein
MALFIPTAGQCFAVVAPVASVWGTIWFLRHGDRVIAQLFPHWQWERELGWLNLRANRRAETVLRGLRHLMHAFLLLALAGILGLSWLVGQRLEMETGPGMFALALELIYIGVGLSVWIFYFAAVLAPRLRDEYEEEELQRYRAEHPEKDDAPRSPPSSRITMWESPRPSRRF